MIKKNKIKQNIIFYIILIFLFTIFLIKIDFFRQFYFLNENSYHERMKNKYGYCDKDSYGFLMDFKKKYVFKKNPLILNSKILPLSNWILYDSAKEFEEYPRIFLNYEKNPSLVFKSHKNEFNSQDKVQLTDMLESITIIAPGEKFILNGKIIISKLYNKQKIIIFKTKINEEINETKSIYTNFETKEFNSRWGNFLIEIKNSDLKQNEINTIVLNFRNKYNFDKTDIIFSKEDCFYIK